MGMCKNITIAFAALVVLLIVSLIAGTVNFPDHQYTEEECSPKEDTFIELTPERLNRFVEALKIPTISRDKGVYNATALLALQTHIKRSFPLIHSHPHIKLELVNKYSLLYTWQGSSSTGGKDDLLPILLCSHLDVVPIANRERWTHDPFAGHVDDEFIWGRGALDDKVGVFGILEATEAMLSRNKTLQLERTIYFAFGHDEEAEGLEGAKEISKLLQSRGVQVEYLLDEGMPVGDGLIPGSQQPVAMIGSSEKGYLTVRMDVEVEGGHSSMPKSESAITVLAQAVSRISSYKQPDRFGQGGPDSLLFEHIATRMKPVFRVLMSNLWFFRPILAMYLGTLPEGNTAVRTTTAVTVLRGGEKSNVLPSRAYAIVNHRVHPLDTCAGVLERDIAAVADPRVNFTILAQTEPAPISPVGDDIFGYRAISRSVRQVFHDTLVAPGLFIAASDTRHYWAMTKNIYRFLPAVMTKGDLKRLHGVDERIARTHYRKVINFYFHLLQNSRSHTVGVAHDDPDYRIEL